MAEHNPQDQGAALTEQQVEQVKEIVRAELSEAEAEAAKTPADLLREAYKPAA